MGIQLNSSFSFEAWSNAAKENAKNAIVSVLTDVGMQCVSEARSNGNYMDQTGNLRSSIGFSIVVDGKVVNSMFADQMGDGRPTNPEGIAQSRKTLADVASTKTSGIFLIVVAGMDYAMKTGIGSYAVQIGDLKIGAVVVLNALGDVYDWKTGEQVAGLLTEDKTGLRSTMDYMCSSIESRDNKFTGNTTLAVVVTNAEFSKPQLCKIAGMAHNGLARSINPVHTSADGDSIYAVSVGNVSADQDLVGSLAAEVVSEALLRSVYSAESAYGLPAAADLGRNSQ